MLGRAGWPLLGLYLAVVGAATVVFAGRHSGSETPRYAVPAPRPGVRENFAALSAGAVLRVSSYDWLHSHHPLYAIDGLVKPLEVEKWASSDRDRAPWMEILPAVRVDVDRVDLDLAGAFEGADLTMREFVLRCLRDEGSVVKVIAERAVHDNTDARPRLPLRCPGTDRLRIEFLVEGKSRPRGVVRLYEVAVWGVPTAP